VRFDKRPITAPEVKKATNTAREAIRTKRSSSRKEEKAKADALLTATGRITAKDLASELRGWPFFVATKKREGGVKESK